MSHFSTVKTKIKDLAALKTAIQQLGLEFEENLDQQIEMKTTWSGNPAEFVDLVIRGSQLSRGADVGFRFDPEAKGYEMVADDWELQRSTVPNFRQKLIEEYSVVQAVKSGYRIIERRVAADGRLQIEVEPVQTRR